MDHDAHEAGTETESLGGGLVVDRVDDIVDEVIESVLSTDGEIVLVEPDGLGERGPIALVLR